MKTILLLAASLAFLHVTHAALKFRSCPGTLAGTNYGSVTSFEISGGNIQQDGSIKVTRKSDLTVKIRVNSKVGATNLKAALYAKVRWLGWLNAVNEDFRKSVGKNEDIDLAFDYHISLFTPSGSYPIAVKISGLIKGNQRVSLGCAVIRLQVV